MVVKNKYMRTPTNIYLVNLAVTDILTLSICKRNSSMIWIKNLSPISAPVWTLSELESIPLALWRLCLWRKDRFNRGYHVCFHPYNHRIHLGKVSWWKYIIFIIFLLPRYLAICHPKLIKKQSSKKIAFKVIILIWAISFLTAWPWAYLTKVKTKVKSCHENISLRSITLLLVEWSWRVVPGAVSRTINKT